MTLRAVGLGGPACPPEVSFGALREVLEAAARVVRESYRPDVAVGRKSDGTPVTQADMRANRLLKRELSRLLPSAGWLSEESADDAERLDREWVWVADPLDGTKEFARGYPEFAISVGLVHWNQVVVGGVLNPVTREGGIGYVDGETSFWGLVAAPHGAESLATAVASISRTEVEDGSILPYLSLVAATRPVGSVAYKLLRVAAGVEDLTFSVQPKSEWDICGGVALLVAAGKAYQRFDGSPCRFNQRTTRIASGAVAGGPRLISAFVSRMSEIRESLA